MWPSSQDETDIQAHMYVYERKSDWEGRRKEGREEKEGRREGGSNCRYQENKREPQWGMGRQEALNTRG